MYANTNNLSHYKSNFPSTHSHTRQLITLAGISRISLDSWRRDRHYGSCDSIDKISPLSSFGTDIKTVLFYASHERKSPFPIICKAIASEYSTFYAFFGACSQASSWWSCNIYVRIEIERKAAYGRINSTRYVIYAQLFLLLYHFIRFTNVQRCGAK
jgi:hypothetical protein